MSNYVFSKETGQCDTGPSFFMAKAIRYARKAAALEETPIGAVIVKDGKVIASGYNLRESRQDVTLHAEMTAIRKACRKLHSWRLDGCDLYVTLEPCIMCAGAIQQARIRSVFFGAFDPKAGGVVSKARIFDLALNHHVSWEGGILMEESSSLLKEFFVSMRAKDKETGLSKGQRRSRNKKTDS
jgi:tRNA(adenine34) deaminase